jgi:GR25 family glycosyltransferase involved in LPS biosynthesis
MKAWKLAASGTQPMMIFEDDCQFPTDWQCKAHNIIDTVPNFDMILLNVLRPKGRHYAKDVLKIDNTIKEKNPCPNVWLSAYAVTPNGAQKLLSLCRKIRPDFNKLQLDWVLNLNWFQSDLNVFVVKTTNQVFIHDETDSDKKNIGA